MRPADLGERIARARAMYSRCHACEWRCHVDRLHGGVGRCGLAGEAHLARECVSVGEEGDLSPSHLVYLGGCSFRCVFCTSGDMVHRPGDFPVVTPEAIAACSRQRTAQGARHLNVLGGDPSVNLLAVLETVARLGGHSLVWNSNFFHTPEAHALLEGVVDTWLADFKFGNDDCARRLAGVDGYGDVVRRNLRLARDGGARLVVRHVVMPGHVECCSRPVAAWLARELPGVEVSLVGAFVPLHRSVTCPELLSPLDGDEVSRRLRAEHALRPVQGAPAATTTAKGYQGTIYVGADGTVTFMDPAPGVLALVG